MYFLYNPSTFTPLNINSTSCVEYSFSVFNSKTKAITTVNIIYKNDIKTENCNIPRFVYYKISVAKL